MSQASYPMVRLATASLAALMLASCALPPRQAWQEIQSRGLITYYMNKESRPLGATAPTSAVAQNRIAPVQAPLPVVGPDRPATPPPAMLNASTMPVAQAVPDLPGYVRTPFTNPPRLVDVRGMSAGSKVVCPYTQRPFLVPGSVSASNNLANNRPKPQAAPERPRTTPVDANTNVAAMTKPAPSAPSTPPAVTPSTAAAAAPELPYGSPIAGRPGFVNSPFAAKHQLVDVTGLPVGMEVKCPYTGKLFRVPPQ
jgi:uncharacterized Zn-finger protein